MAYTALILGAYLAISGLIRLSVVRLIAGVVLILAAVAVVVSLFAHNPGDQLGGIFTVCCVLYLIAPFPSCATC